MKIALQIQAKQGGVPWTVDKSDLFKFKNIPTMVVGYDTSHKKGKSSNQCFNASFDK